MRSRISCRLAVPRPLSADLAAHRAIRRGMGLLPCGACARQSWVPLFLILPAGCGFVEFEPCPGPTSEEIETCAKIAADWRSRVERFDAEDWHNVQECSIRYDNDRKPTELRIRAGVFVGVGVGVGDGTGGVDSGRDRFRVGTGAAWPVLGARLRARNLG